MEPGSDLHGVRVSVTTTMAAISLFGRAVTEHPGKPVYDGVQKWNIATQSLCIIITTGFFGLRAYTRIFILNGFSKEDCT